MGVLAAVGTSQNAWAKVEKALGSASPAVQGAFEGVKQFFTTDKRNPGLGVAFFSQADSVVATTGTLLGTATTVEIYALYAKKGATATAAYLTLAADATGAGAAGTYKLIIPFSSANEEQFWINPEGISFADGLAVMSHTTASGNTATTTAAAGQDGFVIYGSLI